MRIKVGIFFGGPSREREISFVSGRTVYDNLDKELFEPVPIFVDSYRKWYLLDWQYLYWGTIRDFFPPIDMAPKSEHGFQVYQESSGPLDELSLEAMGQKIGRRIRRYELSELIDVAFLALHGEYGEDGQLQRELEYAGIPYTGSGVEASKIGIDKAIQKELMSAKGFVSSDFLVIEKGDFDGQRVQKHFAICQKEIGWPMVIRPARQGSSIGVAIIEEADGIESFERAVNAAFFRELLPLSEYAARDEFERLEYIRSLSSLIDGVAFPLDAKGYNEVLTLYTPDELYEFLEDLVSSHSGVLQSKLITFTGHQSEERVIVESFIRGTEFSTIVIRNDYGQVVALPPTEIVKPVELFDYRSKYMAGRSSKVTPINLPAVRIQAIRTECERLFEVLGFQVYALIDGFHTSTGQIFLNDSNTISKMLPNSLIFHQAAEIGLNPSQFLTFIIRQSLRERGMEWAVELGDQLDVAIKAQRVVAVDKERIIVLFGDDNLSSQISLKSGQNIYEKLASSQGYRPLPLCLINADIVDTTSSSHFHKEEPEKKEYKLFQLPINIFLKDSIDAIHNILFRSKENPVIKIIRQECASITTRYADVDYISQPRELAWDELPKVADGVFITMNGRPGEDGQLQAKLEPLGLYYNGSGIESSQITINKFETLNRLRETGLLVTGQWLATLAEFKTDETTFYNEVEELFGYPLIAKPVDESGSPAVKLIKNREELAAYCQLTFSPGKADKSSCRRLMKLTVKEKWPVGKKTILFEFVLGTRGAPKFLEITGGMLTHIDVNGELRYEIFEPSEKLSRTEVLSLEEKLLFDKVHKPRLARFSSNKYSYDYVAERVKADLERVARALKIEGYCQVNAFVRVFGDGRVQTIPIKVKSLPSITPDTAIIQQAILAAYKPAEFIDRVLQFGKIKKNDRYSRTKAYQEKQIAYDRKQAVIQATAMRVKAAEIARKQVSKDLIHPAISTLKPYLAHPELLEGKLSELENEVVKGIVSADNASLKKAQLREAILIAAEKVERGERNA